MNFSFFPDPSSRQTPYQVGILLCVMLVLFLKLAVTHNSAFYKPLIHKQEIFQSLPPQVLEFSLRGASY
jgi:hypothetical protein